MLFITLMMIPRNCNSSSPSQPFFLQRHSGKTDICQTCGDKGDLKRLIYCVQCQVSANHSYCIGKFHKDDDGTISWKCEECSLNDAKCRSTPLRRSARISQATETKHNGVKSDRESHEEACVGQSCKAESSDENQELPIKKRRHLDIKDEKFLYEECETPTSPSNIPSHQPKSDPEKYADTKTVNSGSIDGPYPECSKYSQAEPVPSPAWRGQLRINKAIVLGVGAHVSVIACSKVHSTVSGLPPVVDVKLFSRFDIWPPSFRRSPPSNDSIGLYIFPQCESDEKVFDGVMRDMIEQNLSLRAIITHNVELLIFSSRVLPVETWRMRGKYYLWGVFRQKGSSEDTGCATS
ncbi:uncharacterized protein LOC129320163 isoform X2 [Prosopis cineraria]|uniref:uncharacterized protein LOC129320163 isoform X2 n=1 Tax=Prosopis cineraria TaxID=364024 RepID=UPI00240F6DF1|nr:uncharacterized protein LOC129320163 isoform X2 [Prosopis cineraria]